MRDDGKIANAVERCGHDALAPSSKAHKGQRGKGAGGRRTKGQKAEGAALRFSPQRQALIRIASGRGSKAHMGTEDGGPTPSRARPHVGKKRRSLQKVEGVWGVSSLSKSSPRMTSIKGVWVRQKGKNVNHRDDAFCLFRLFISKKIASQPA
jgi:hypothetical protein